MRLVVLFFLLISTLQGSEVIIDRTYSPGTSIKVVAPINVLPNNGFFPVRVETSNKTSSGLSWIVEAQTIKRSRHYSSRGDAPTIETEFSVNCPSGQSKVTELLIPVHQRGNDTATHNGEQFFTLSIKSSSYEGNVVSGGFANIATTKFQNFAVSDQLSDLYVPTKVENALNAKRMRVGYHGEMIGASFTVENLPEDWRAYAGYNALVFARADYLRVSPMVKVALKKWVHGGGNLIILNDSGVLPESEFPGDKFPGKVVREGFGSRQVIECGAKFSDFDAELLISGLDVASKQSAETAQSDYSWGNEWALGKELGSRSLQTNLTLIALIIFGVVVGPVNLFVWADKTRRHRLFFTTPLISLVMSVLLIGIIVVRDGFGGDGVRAIAIDVGGPGSNSTSILQEQFSRTGILFSSTFELDEHSVINALHAPMTEYNLADSNSAQAVVSYRAKSKGKGWEFSGDWFESRAEQAQIARSVFPSRERLELISSVDGAPRLVSSFSYSLENVFFRESDGKVWSAKSISSGETVTLAPSSSDEQLQGCNHLVERFGETHQEGLRHMIKRPGSFSAQAVGAPAIDSYDAIDWKESPALITGLLK